jgi:hypothetical protein
LFRGVGGKQAIVRLHLRGHYLDAAEALLFEGIEAGCYFLFAKAVCIPVPRIIGLADIGFLEAIIKLSMDKTGVTKAMRN